MLRSSAAVSAMLGVLATLCAALPSASVADTQQGPIGRWDRDDGLGGVRISRCGGSLCGHIVWLKNPEGPGHVGQRVLYGMKRTASDTWSGLAHNPEDDGTYSGSMTLAGDRLITRGCAAGGLLCQSVGLSRVR